MLSEKSLKIVGCEQDEQGYWIPDNDGDFDYITEEHIIGGLVMWLVNRGCTIGAWQGGEFRVTHFTPRDDIGNMTGHFVATNADLLICLDEAVQAVNEKGD